MDRQAGRWEQLGLVVVARARWEQLGLGEVARSLAAQGRHHKHRLHGQLRDEVWLFQLGVLNKRY